VNEYVGWKEIDEVAKLPFYFLEKYVLVGLEPMTLESSVAQLSVKMPR
jgi:hypothetical protein